MQIATYKASGQVCIPQKFEGLGKNLPVLILLALFWEFAGKNPPQNCAANTPLLPWALQPRLQSPSCHMRRKIFNVMAKLAHSSISNAVSNAVQMAMAPPSPPDPRNFLPERPCGGEGGQKANQLNKQVQQVIQTWERHCQRDKMSMTRAIPGQIWDNRGWECLCHHFCIPNQGCPRGPPPRMPRGDAPRRSASIHHNRHNLFEKLGVKGLQDLPSDTICTTITITIMSTGQATPRLAATLWNPPLWPWPGQNPPHLPH